MIALFPAVACVQADMRTFQSRKGWDRSEHRGSLTGVAMTTQFSLFGGEEPPSSLRPPASSAAARQGGRHSLFFALAPMTADAEAIVEAGTRIARECGVRGKALEARRLHVSLYAIGQYEDVFPQRLVDMVMPAAANVAHAAFDVAFDRAACFSGAGAFVLKSSTDDALSALHAFRRALGTALADAGLPITDRKMTPHMTLSYGAVAAPELAIAPVRWRAREFVLIDSHVGRHLHRVLGRWALAD
jgi:RNA 2',3'-cyclic 3'-phosphodiesterase